MYHSDDIAICETYMGCSYIYNTYHIEHRSLEIRKTRYDFSVQVRNFLLPLSLKVFRQKEREAQSFYSDFFISPPPPYVWHPLQRSRDLAKANRLLLRQVSTLLTFFKFPKSSARFRCVTSFALASPISHLRLLWHLWVTRPLCARAWTPVLMLHLSNPCTEPNGSQPN